MATHYYNSGTDFDVCQKLWDPPNNALINLSAVNQSVTSLCNRRGQDKNGQIASLLRAVTCIDLTTLCGDDTESNVQRLCHKAVNPIHEEILKQFGFDSNEIHVGAVCVYPSRVQDCVKTLKSLGSEIPVAAVAAGFPSGQYHMDTRLDEIRNCVKDGAKEIDIVISRDLVSRGEWEVLYDEVNSMRAACGQDAHLKTIIAAGELGSLDNVYKTSLVCMAAGADFVKTSTGKESVNATLPIGMTMIRAINDYFIESGQKVGFKPAGGIRTAKDVFMWQALMRHELGPCWLYPSLFRIGASGLLGDIEQTLFQHATGYCASKCLFPYQ